VPKSHLNETVEEMKKFNNRRRLKSIILASVSSSKWQRPIVKSDSDSDDDEKIFLEDQASSIGMNLSILYFNSEFSFKNERILL